MSTNNISSKLNKMELLAPAGSLEICKAVVAAGANAVYVGGNLFSARAYATNFTNEELLEAIEFCHLYGAKLHVTINTCLKNKEISEALINYVTPLYEAGLDAVIVQDMGVWHLLRDNFPGLELHASTQTTLTGIDGVGLMKSIGASRVVLARELSLDEISKIHEAYPDLEIETFVHGALCVCYSGQCLFSGYLGGRSGNRGRCAGPCRLSYTVEMNNKNITPREYYPLSLKDFCGIEFLGKLQQAGVSSLKIEGRMKKKEYAAGVVSIYRKYLDRLYEVGPDNYSVDKNDYDLLMSLGNRSGFTSSYLTEHNNSSMITGDSPAHTSGGQIAIKDTPDRIPLYSKVFLHLNQRPAILLSTCKFDKVSDIVDKIKDLDSFSAHENGIYISALKLDTPISAAKNAPATIEDVNKTLRQTGDTYFEFESLDIEMDENLFIPKQILKTLRRQSIELIQKEIIKNGGIKDIY